jgi:Glyoxalase/Bleomycin resistance protein/Dioxygenase superfamily
MPGGLARCLIAAVLALACDLHAASLGPPSGAPRISGVSMTRVVGIDHLVIRVGDYEKSKSFYSQLFDFLGFEISENTKTPSA